MENFWEKDKKNEWDFKISKSDDFEILPHLDVQKVAVACLILELQDSFLAYKPKFIRIKNHILEPMSQDHS